MGESIVHRGPDGGEIWLDGDNSAGLVFRRLSIIDLSDAGMQPMHSPDNRFHIVYNGEIYNYLKLKSELEKLGHTFISRADSEVLLHSLMEWGIDALEKTEGMFAFCFYDSAEKKAWLVRDRIGIKPLYYKFQDGICYFASEIKALIAHPKISADIDPLAAYHYLTFLTTPAPLTMFEGIGKIPAGYLIEISFAKNGRSPSISSRQYWDSVAAPSDDDRFNDENWVKEQIRTLLTEAIEKRMMSDVPFGVFLSGGIDSSTNVALMNACMTQPVKTFSVGFSDQPQFNELEYARKVRDLFKTDHHEVLIDSNDAQNYLDQLIISQDEPIADWVCVPLYFVSRLVRENDTIVVQVGEGSDEQFFGYDNYMEHLDQKKKYWDVIKGIPKPVQGALYGMSSLMASMNPNWSGRKDKMFRAWKDRELFWGGAVCYNETFKQDIVSDRTHWESLVKSHPWVDTAGLLPGRFNNLDSFEVIDTYLSKVRTEKPSADFMERMIYLEFKLRLVELLLMRVDKITMSTSIEARVPFLDHKLVEFSMNIPSEMKIKNGVTKYILKEAVRGLIPDQIIDRKKVGFGAPVSEWLHGSLGDRIKSTFKSTGLRERNLIDFDQGINLIDTHRSGRDFAYPIWSLFNLALWYDHWVSGGNSNPLPARSEKKRNDIPMETRT
jgi:asparagine synthase (glutamine-hydrolysing)